MPETGVRSPDPSLRQGWRDRSDAGSAHILMSDCQKSPAQIGNPRRILSGARMSGGIQGLWCWLVLWHFFFSPPSRQLGLDLDLVAPPREVGTLLLEKMSLS